MLSAKEHRYFSRIRNHVSSLFRLNVQIFPLDHKRFLPVEEGEEVLGCCHKILDGAGRHMGHVITIDEPYIKACYHGRQTQYSPFSDNQLIETICHEIAHLQIWDHNEEHKDLTNSLYDEVMRSLSFQKSSMRNGK